MSSDPWMICMIRNNAQNMIGIFSLYKKLPDKFQFIGTLVGGAACPCPRATLVGRKRPARAGVLGRLCELVRKGRIGVYGTIERDKLVVLNIICGYRSPQPVTAPIVAAPPCPKAGTAELHRKHQPDKLKFSVLFTQPHSFENRAVTGSRLDRQTYL